MDLIGFRFGCLTVIKRSKKAVPSQRDPFWMCRCDCGTVKAIAQRHLRSGRTVACGCQRGLNPKYGPMTVRGTPEYDAWSNMRRRCNDPHHSRYADWGGRGITVCRRWDNFASFLADMGPKPTPKHQLDRINNDGPYSPENCRWATLEQQRQNTRPRQYVRGPQHHNARLTEDDVRDIRAMHRRGIGGGTIAQCYGVNKASIYSILRGHTWKHVA